MWNKFLKNKNGFTGLEAAIVLVAFVVVAAVFSYVMLGAGFFTTQKSQEVVHTGVTQASSSIAPSGDVIVSSTANGQANVVTLYFTNTAGGTSVDLDKTVISYTDNDDFVTKEYGTAGPNNGNQGWVYIPRIFEVGHDNNLLEKGEKYKVVITLAAFGVTTPPGVNENVKIEVKPPEGAVFTLTRTMPPALVQNTHYPVY
ncbi:MAG: archaellin/type IV pilin N-terminal domain-containing protein [Methanosarcina sp.]